MDLISNSGFWTRVPSPESRNPSSESRVPCLEFLKAEGILPMSQLVGGENAIVQGQSRVGVSGPVRQPESRVTRDCNRVPKRSRSGGKATSQGRLDGRPF